MHHIFIYLYMYIYSYEFWYKYIIPHTLFFFEDCQHMCLMCSFIQISTLNLIETLKNKLYLETHSKHKNTLQNLPAISNKSILFNS